MMRPAVGGTMPMMHFMSVLLPLPLVPSKHDRLAVVHRSEMPSSTCTDAVAGAQALDA